MPAVFIAQGTLQQWADAGKVRLDDTTLFLLKEQREVLLRPAVRFTRLTVGEADPHGLLGKVKSSEQLGELGAEHYLDSVILGDLAYEVVEGFLGDLQGGRAAPAAPPSVVLPATPVPPTVSPAPVLPTVSPAPVPPTVSPAGQGETEEPESAADGDSELVRLSQLFLDTVR